MPDPFLSPRPRQGVGPGVAGSSRQRAAPSDAAGAAQALAAPIPSDASSGDGSVPDHSGSEFEDAYRQHAGVVHALARRLLGDRSLAEEVTQEVFLRLWHRPDRFDAARGNLRTFLLTECHGRSIDTIRSQSARRRREERDGRSSGREASPDLADDVCVAAVHDEVATLLRALPDLEPEAISLAYSDHSTYREVAEILGAPEGTVKGRIRTGLRRMRAQMDTREPEV